MRNMSFAITTNQILDKSKDVTRRLGWLKLKAGDLVQPVQKCMGLKPGEKIVRIGAPIRILKVDRESLSMLADTPYGHDECKREGFPEMQPAEFVTMFCKSHTGCKPDSVVTRIEFEYTE